MAVTDLGVLWGLEKYMMKEGTQRKIKVAFTIINIFINGKNIVFRG